MAAAADSRYTLELVDKLIERSLRTLLVWGAEDEFQSIAFGERYAHEISNVQLVPIDGARHIPPTMPRSRLAPRSPASSTPVDRNASSGRSTAATR